ncbi:hypothetical protein P154DRAFT_568066 [Amniculicola lignicola CBS 123094]|uniref:Uncharacterized protein n=1 Tax=Amniculicola lignicola CBS 123094 TaxID=1392246 RepID=A0A6A5W2K0_9PLEO|nr:hypothetical protein P154DRAFT_568066 [Amniculicola lignicola CBS 123094]
MFGHPGISTFSYAGVQKTNQQDAALAPRKDSAASKTQGDNTTSPDMPEVAQAVLPPVAPESPGQQRPRGTFINHTPRVFEARSPRKMNAFEAKAGALPHDACQSSFSDGNASNQHWEYKPWDVDNDLSSREVSALMRQRQSKRSNPATAPTNPTIANTSRKQIAPEASLIAMDHTSPQYSKTSIRTTHSSEVSVSPPPIEYGQPAAKKRRRQIPSKLPSTPNHVPSCRYSPLEPWVEKHRRQATNSSVASSKKNTIPVDIQAIGAASTERTIQEYFNSQPSARSFGSVARRRSSNAPNAPLPKSPEFTIPSSPPEPTGSFPIENLTVCGHSPPEIPSRSPLRLTQSPTLPFINGKTRASGDSSDFESAARGNYSPYNDKFDDGCDGDVLATPKRRTTSPFVGQAATPGSSARGRMAPPILGPKEFTTKATENDLSYYLKNTGPTEERKDEKGKKGFRILKGMGRKGGAGGVESSEGPPRRPKYQPLVPACAQETTTSGGARHLQIIIPDGTLLTNQTLTIPVHPDPSSNILISRHISVAFTDEMLNPLASPKLETAISSFNCPDASPAKPMSPMPRKSPVALKPVPVEEHPLLASREDVTRARKLRDLRRVRGERNSKATQTVESSVARALPTPAQSPMTSLQEFEEVEEEEETTAERMARIQRRSISMQRLLAKVTEELARVIGLESEDGEADLNPQLVLQASRRIRVSWSGVGE